METCYHGTCRLFKAFSLDHLGEGEGKSKFGQGIYITESYDTAALYAAKAGKANGVNTYYVYTVEIPAMTTDNHLFSCRPVAPSIVAHIEEALKTKIPIEAVSAGKLFRKYVGNFLTGQKGTVKQMIGKTNDTAEHAVSEFLHEQGLVFLAWPQSQANPDGLTNRAVLHAKDIRIVKIEQVQVNDKNQLIPGSQHEVTL